MMNTTNTQKTGTPLVNLHSVALLSSLMCNDFHGLEAIFNKL